MLTINLVFCHVSLVISLSYVMFHSIICSDTDVADIPATNLDQIIVYSTIDFHLNVKVKPI